jgi:hypothetical protein
MTTLTDEEKRKLHIESVKAWNKRNKEKVKVYQKTYLSKPEVKERLRLREREKRLLKKEESQLSEEEKLMLEEKKRLLEKEKQEYMFQQLKKELKGKELKLIQSLEKELGDDNEYPR